MRDETANGFKLIFRVAIFQGHGKGGVDTLNGGVPAHTVGSVGQTKNVAIVLGNVELVLDLTDDLLQHILNCHQTCYPTKLINHDGQVVSIAPKLSQQVIKAFGFRNEYCRPQQSANIETRRAL